MNEVEKSSLRDINNILNRAVKMFGKGDIGVKEYLDILHKIALRSTKLAKEIYEKTHSEETPPSPNMEDYKDLLIDMEEYRSLIDITRECRSIIVRVSLAGRVKEAEKSSSKIKSLTEEKEKINIDDDIYW